MREEETFPGVCVLARSANTRRASSGWDAMTINDDDYAWFWWPPGVWWILYHNLVILDGMRRHLTPMRGDGVIVPLYTSGGCDGLVLRHFFCKLRPASQHFHKNYYSAAEHGHNDLPEQIEFACISTYYILFSICFPFDDLPLSVTSCRLLPPTVTCTAVPPALHQV